MPIARRQFLHHAAAVAGGTLAFPSLAAPLARLCAAQPAGQNGAAAGSKPNHLTLSIGTYAMPGVPLEKALTTIAEAGFDGVEIAVHPGYADPASLSVAKRKEVKAQLESLGLRLTALMEHLLPADDAAEHSRQLDRLARVMELAAHLGQGQPPLIQTVLGNGTWENRRDFYRDRLGNWLELAQRHKAVLAIKPHRSGAMSQPSQAIWLIEQLGNSPRLRMVYDYSHYAYRDLPLEDTVHASLPYTAHVAVKDAVQQGNRVAFLLPGEQNTHYQKLLKLLYDGGYRGDICCEVSSLISRQPDYDPVAAAKTCYRNMAAAFEKANVPRPKM